MNAQTLLVLLRRAGVSKTVVAGVALYMVAIGAIGPETLFGQWLPHVFDIRVRIYGLILGPKEVLASILAAVVLYGRFVAKGPLWITANQVVNAVLASYPADPAVSVPTVGHAAPVAPDSLDATAALPVVPVGLAALLLPDVSPSVPAASKESPVLTPVTAVGPSS
jgi:hypothetical protein